jgi:HSP20 family molecular chaperone IbpA
VSEEGGQLEGTLPQRAAVAAPPPTPGAYLVRVELPGLAKDDVSVSLDGHVLRAEFKDGVPSAHVPKAEHAQPRSIEVTAA